MPEGGGAASCATRWVFTSDRIAVRFAYECHDGSGHW
jgi:nuclear transport factor 2 (NTF2) superfamily protein